jgi:hypothetical protein
VVALGALAGCAGSEPETPAAAASTPTAAPATAFLEPGLRFSDEAVKAYRKALAEVDSRVAADDNALRHGWDICLDIEQGTTNAQVARNAAGRFEVDDTTAKAIVEATKSSLCMR